MQVILFSKDRPLQLHATLTSFARHCVESESLVINVVYRATSEDFARGYQQLREHQFGFATLTWIEEKSFKDDLLRVLYATTAKSSWPSFLRRYLLSRSIPLRSRHVLFLVDDTLFVRSFSLQRMVEALAHHPKALAFSLRLGRNTIRCYSRNRQQRLPEFRSEGADRLVFRWVGEEGDFGYPLEISSSLYRGADLIGLLTKLPYNNPNRLEQALSVCSKLFTRRMPELLCLNHSVAFCAPVNKVQSVINNRASDSQAYTSEALNVLFLKGVRIDVAQLDHFLPQAAHQEIELPLFQPSAHP
ncbi:MAG: hypothetical protein VKO39_01995 [Cyanobacteriota bacterium]|nr:hypothetical protein [Cyanobacteriota bacterium]